jgi:hypothetical protein
MFRENSPPLSDVPEKQLREDLRTLARGMPIHYEAIVQELDRRARNRQALWSLRLSAVGLAIAAAAILITALKA